MIYSECGLADVPAGKPGNGRRSGWSDRIGAEIDREVGKAIRAAEKAVAD